MYAYINIYIIESDECPHMLAIKHTAIARTVEQGPFYHYGLTLIQETMWLHPLKSVGGNHFPVSQLQSCKNWILWTEEIVSRTSLVTYCPACRTTLIATRFRVAVICPIIQVPHCIRVFFYFVWFVFINHIFQFYNKLCTYCNILDIHLS